MRLSQIMSVGIVVVPVAFGGGYYLGNATRLEPGQPAIEAHFSPHGGCTAVVVAELDRATGSIEVQAYSFTSAPIAQALVAAQGRGVKVTVVLDPSQRTEQNSKAETLVDAGVPTYIDPQHAIAHNKIMLIDGQTIVTGSFNFTNQAERANAENLLVIRDDPPLFAAYEENFRGHLAHSELFQDASEPRYNRQPGAHSKHARQPRAEVPATSR
jgi:phosphatidylserine/phosphatidylglycerophosphate/cardiolipin synthase-like enzyme